MFELVDDVDGMSHEDGAPINDGCVSWPVFILKYGIGAGLLSEKDFEASPHFKRNPDIKRSTKTRNPISKNMQDVTTTGLLKVYLKSTQWGKRSYATEKDFSVRDINVDVSIFQQMPYAIVSLLELVQTANSIFDNWKRMKVCQIQLADVIGFYSNGSFTVNGNDNQHRPFLLSWTGEFKTAKKTTFENWHHKIKSILTAHDNGEDLLQSTKFVSIDD